NAVVHPSPDDYPPIANSRLPENDAFSCTTPPRIDEDAREILIGSDRLNLTSLEYNLLKLLMDRQNACLTRDEILEKVWSIEYEPGTNVVDVHIYALRRKLQPYGLDSMIETVRGVGYRYSSELPSSDAEA